MRIARLAALPEGGRGSKPESVVALFLRPLQQGDEQEFHAAVCHPALMAHQVDGDFPLLIGRDEIDKNLMQSAMNQLQLSARVYHRVLKLARTIADLAGSENIRPSHLAEALQYRPRLV